MGMVLGVACTGCSNPRLNCDSPAPLALLQQLVAGISGEPNSQGNAWLDKAVAVVVLNEKADDSGRHLSCEANVTISPEIIQKSKTDAALVFRIKALKGSASNSMTVHYNVGVSSDYSKTTVSLEPPLSSEFQAVQLLREILQPAYNDAITASLPPQVQVDRLPEPTPKEEQAKKRDFLTSIFNKVRNFIGSMLAAAGPSSAPNNTIAAGQMSSAPKQKRAKITKAGTSTAVPQPGKYHRTKPSGDLVLTKEGDDWRVVIKSASFATDPMKMGADCHIQAVGPVSGDHLVAHPVPFSDDDIEVTADDVHDMDSLDLTIRERSVTVNSPETYPICGQNQDFTGTYSLGK